MVFELLASSVRMDRSDADVLGWMDHYGARPERMGARDEIATVAQPVKVQDDLYVRDYERCILCYKCVEACGDDAQHTYAIATAGRGFDAHISTEFDVTLPDSACVYCGNCIGVCPTGALVFKTDDDQVLKIYDTDSRSWQDLDRSFLDSVRTGLRMAKEQIPPDLMTVPVPAPQAAAKQG